MKLLENKRVFVFLVILLIGAIAFGLLWFVDYQETQRIAEVCGDKPSETERSGIGSLGFTAEGRRVLIQSWQECVAGVGR